MNAEWRGLPIGIAALTLAACVSDVPRPAPPVPPTTAPRDVPVAAEPAAPAPEAPPPADEPAPAESERTVLPTTWDVGMPVLEATIDGKGPYRLMLDTGTGFLVLATRVADELKLERRDLTPDGSGVPVDAHGNEARVRQVVRINHLGVGPVELRDVGAVVIDLSTIERASGTRIDGIFPAPTLHDGLLTVDIGRRTVTFARGELPPADDAEVLDLVAGQPLPFVTIDLGDRVCPVLVDTGMRGFLDVPASRESTLRFRAAPTVTRRQTTAAGTAPLREGRLDGTLSWGRHRIADPVIGFSPASYAVAGMQLLREFRTTFDFTNGRVRFERASNEPIRTSSVRSAGAGFLRDAETWTVAYVLDGSAAARAGLRVGDRIEAVDGVAVREIGFLDYEAIVRSRDSLTLRVVGAGGARDVPVAIVTLVE